MDDILGGLTPQKLQELLATNADPATLEELKTQGAYADALRKQRPEGGSMAGNVYIPNINAALAPIINGYAANKIDKFTAGQRKTIYGKQAELSQDFINAMKQIAAARAQQPNMPMQAPASTGMAGVPMNGSY